MDDIHGLCGNCHCQLSHRTVVTDVIGHRILKATPNRTSPMDLSSESTMLWTKSLILSLKTPHVTYYKILYLRKNSHAIDFEGSVRTTA